jgi:hypothetical protein
VNLVRILAWLFGKNEPPVTAAAEQQTVTAPKLETPQSAPGPHGRMHVSSEAENLRRWRESGQARTWVEARQGRWNHDDWLALLEELKRSPFWPMPPDAVGLVLEDEKRERLQRN